MQSSGHKRFFGASLEEAPKGAEKFSQEFCSVLQA